MRKSMLAILIALGIAGLVVPGGVFAKDPRLSPKRLSSTGDSITEAINAEEFNPFIFITPNHWASWANGYYGFWEWLFGRTNVKSHNQRISSNFGSSGRKNFMQALSGADSFDLPGQTAQSVSNAATYVTHFMGHNDVCQGSFADIPSDAQFEANVRAGLNNMKNGLPNGATVYVQAIVDIYKLWQLGDQLTSFGIIDCRVIWAASLFNIFPCATMLSPLNSEADRQYTRSRNVAFNTILQNLVNEFNANDTHHYYQYTTVTFDTTFTADQVSPFDCFHPSAKGQKDLSAYTWADGPFKAYTK
ncbi:MAG: SGNH/GDSL hydrolase family protein [Deltaproteobacteria bacterium]|nr:SGNH/GDSL hydrolase family protein [Deltaproteobacteria bacterium]